MANYKIMDSKRWLYKQIKLLFNKGDKINVEHSKDSFIISCNNNKLYKFNYIDETYSCGVITNAFDDRIEKIIKLSIKYREMIK